MEHDGLGEGYGTITILAKPSLFLYKNLKNSSHAIKEVEST